MDPERVGRPGDCADDDAATNPAAWDVCQLCEDGVYADCSGTDNPCRAAPTGQRPIAEVAGIRVDLPDTFPIHSFGTPGDTDGDGIPEIWARNGWQLWTAPAIPGSPVHT